MLRYVKRTREVALALLGCDSAVQDVYNMLEFHRSPDSEISNAMSVKQLSDMCGLSRQHIYTVLDELVDMELIEIAKTKKRGVYHFLLLKLKQSEVVQMPDPVQTVESQPEQEQATITDNPEPKRGFLGGILE